MTRHERGYPEITSKNEAERRSRLARWLDANHGCGGPAAVVVRLQSSATIAATRFRARRTAQNSLLMEIGRQSAWPTPAWCQDTHWRGACVIWPERPERMLAVPGTEIAMGTPSVIERIARQSPCAGGGMLASGPWTETSGSSDQQGKTSIRRDGTRRAAKIAGVDSKASTA